MAICFLLEGKPIIYNTYFISKFMGCTSYVHIRVHLHTAVHGNKI